MLFLVLPTVSKWTSKSQAGAWLRALKEGKPCKCIAIKCWQRSKPIHLRVLLGMAR